MDDDLLFLLAGLNPKSAARSPAVVGESMRELCLGFNAEWNRVLQSKKKELSTIWLCCLNVLEHQPSTSTTNGKPSSSSSPLSLRRAKHAALRLLLLVDFSALSTTTTTTTSAGSSEWQRMVDAVCVAMLPQAGSADDDDELFPAGVCSCDVACEALLGMLASYNNAVVDPHAVVAYCSTPSSLGLLLRVACMERVSINNPALSALLVQSPACLSTLVDSFKDNSSSAVRALINVTNLLPDCHALAREIVPVAQARVSHIFASSSSSLTNNNKDALLLQFDDVLLLLTLLANLVELPENRASELLAPSQLCAWFRASLPVRTQHDLDTAAAGEWIEFAWTPEELVLSAHVCLVLGCVVRDSASHPGMGQFVDALPGAKKRGFAPQVQVLQAFVDFQAQAGVSTPEMQESVGKVAEHFITANQRLMLPPPLLVQRGGGGGAARRI